MGVFEPAARCYCLCLEHSRAGTVSAGALGKFSWPAGWTYYVGRARRGWAARLKRFTGQPNSNFWHVDYLVNSAACRIGGVLPVDWPASEECRLAGQLDEIDPLGVLVEGFGASDCERNCSAHAWVGEITPDDLVGRLLRREVPLPGRVSFEADRCTWRPVS